jgi:O-antigen/teichoic acid export membrane protein
VLWHRLKQLGSDSLVYGLGNALSLSANFLLLPLYSRIFTPDEFGVIDLLTTLSTILAVFIIMGFTSAQTFFFFEDEQLSSRRLLLSTSFLFRLVVALFLCGTLFMSAEIVAQYLLQDVQRANLLRVTAAYVAVLVMRTLFANILRLLFVRLRYLIVTVGSTAFMVLLIILFVWIGDWRLQGVVWGRFLGTLAGVMVGFLFIREYVAFEFSHHRLLDMIKYGLPLLPSELSVWGIRYIGRYFVLSFGGLGDVGLYSYAGKLAMAIGLVTYAIRIAWPPLAMSIAKQEDAKTFYAKVTTYYIIGLSLLAVFLSLFSRDIIALISASSYLPAHRAVGIMAFAEIGYGLIPILGIGLMIEKRTGIIGLALAVGFVADLVANVILVPWLGVAGAAMATTLSFICTNLIMWFKTKSVYPINYETKRIVVALLLSWLVIGAGLLLPTDMSEWLTLTFKSSLVIGLIVALVALSVIETQELRLVYNKLVTRRAVH